MEKVHFRIRPAALLRFLGYRDLAKISRLIVQAAEEAAGEAAGLATPRGGGALVSFEVHDGRVVARDGPGFESKLLARVLAGTSRAVFFAVTIGDQIDERARTLYDSGDRLKWLCLEAAGILALHQAHQTFRRRLRLWLGGKCQLTPRFSPGYGDWALAEQSKLFRLLNGISHGISLTEGSIMVPGKSLSGVVGIHPTDSVPTARIGEHFFFEARHNLEHWRQAIGKLQTWRSS